ncbi:MAG: transcriptional regulator PpsR [Burkholderiaceae bacterium]|nr:transcriptional regulator PpsR [Burkholderiaceae bacterium]
MTKRPPESLDLGTDLGALAHLAPELAATFVTVASDIALVIDRDGVIRNVAVGGAEGVAPASAEWVGRRWADTVTDDTRRKIEQLVDEANATGVSRRREVNLRAAAGDGVPVAYAAVRLGEQGPLLAVGRDMRSIAAIQQRFLESQQQMERDYWKRRQTEARYRLLFQVATDAVLVVDAHSRRVVEANRAACVFFGCDASLLADRDASAGFAPAARQAVDQLLASSHTLDRASEIRLRNGTDLLAVSVTPFRADGVPLLLVRVRAADGADDAAGDSEAGDSEFGRLAELVERTPDAIVVTDAAGQVRFANPAFLALAGLPPATEVAGRALSEWVGQGAREVDDLLDLVCRHGMVSRVLGRMRGVHAAEVEISAALLPEADGEHDSIGLTLRRMAPRSEAEAAVFDELTRAVERLAERVGSLILPSLMREGADLVERQLLRAALARSVDDLPAAARLLGISEESLALRLRRHGLQPGGGSTVTH